MGKYSPNSSLCHKADSRGPEVILLQGEGVEWGGKDS